MSSPPSPVERMRSALTAQATSAEVWLAGLDQDTWDRPSALPDWRVADLAGHFGTVLRSVHEALSTPAESAPIEATEYVTRMGAAADQIRDIGREEAAGLTRDDLLDVLRDQLSRADAALGAIIAMNIHPARAVVAPRGPVQIGDYLASRMVEVVVHTDDLARSVPEVPPPTFDTGAVAAAVRALAALLAQRAPGNSAELRVPPHAAVQCVEGPRHTRGTPPNVVETDPMTWVRLASGRLDWATATADGLVTASGERSDLSPYLPVLR